MHIDYAGPFLGKQYLLVIDAYPKWPEKFVDTFKRAMKKINCKTTSESLQTFLSVYRTTPNVNVPGGKTPAEIMLGRHYKTIFDLLKPKFHQLKLRTSKQDHSFLEIWFELSIITIILILGKMLKF